MDTRDFYKIVVALDRKAKAAPVKKECGCGGNCKCNKSQVTESRNVLNLLASMPNNRGRDPFEMVYDALSGTAGREVENELQAKYEEIARDNGWHPDDDFEKIINTMIDDYYDSKSVDEEDETLDDSATQELAEIKSLTFRHEI
jgi:hypothetical protein